MASPTGPTDQAGDTRYLPRWWLREPKDLEPILEGLIDERLPAARRVIERARKRAARLHRRQERQGGGEYIAHPLRIAISLMDEFGINEADMIKAALLHDVLEDTGATKTALDDQFGKKTGDLVDILTRQKGERRGKRGDSRQSPYLARIRKSGTDGVLLKLADKLDNLRDAPHHPNLARRRVYVRETYTAYLPLLGELQDTMLRGNTERLLLEALEDNGAFDRLDHQRHLLGRLAKAASSACPGEAFRANLPSLDRVVDTLFLLDPCLPYWLSWDGAQLVRTTPAQRDLATNVSAKLVSLIGSDRLPLLLRAVGMPAGFADPERRDQWRAVAAQLHLLIRLLRTGSVPRWMEPLLEDDHRECLLLAVHSRLLLPASWTFPLWHQDYGAMLAATRRPQAYRAATGKRKTVDRWCAILEFLLTNREALLRYHTGVGSGERLQRVVDLADSLAASGVDREALWAARLLTEFLDCAAREATPTTVLPTVTGLWQRRRGDLLAGVPLPGGNRWRRLLKGRAGRSLPSLAGVELDGYEETQRIFSAHRLTPTLEQLLVLLVRHSAKAPGSLTWICFDASEFKKRQQLFTQPGGLATTRGRQLRRLPRQWIQASEESIGGSTVLTVRPAPHYAFRNRLPETTPDQMRKMEAADFSATAIFDVMIGDALSGGDREPRAGQASPVWVPRVYRVLDTIEDLDSRHVQRLQVALNVDGQPQRFRAYLPLPHEDRPEEANGQDARKRIVARYIATQAYNYGVTRRVRDINVECAATRAGSREHAFSEDELRDMISQAEREHHLRDWYGDYIEDVNYSLFEIDVGLGPPPRAAFGPREMQYGTFVGIDIGGTDTKFCLIVKGQAKAARRPGVPKLLSIRTSGTWQDKDLPVDVRRFCKRLVGDSQVRRWLSAQGTGWGDVRGVGIAWAGAVRNSRIVGMSRNLAKLKVPQPDGSWLKLGYDSPARDIHRFDFAAWFAEALREVAGLSEDQLPTVTMVNDGDAEAYGNYCALVQQGRMEPGGRIIVKLGTSLAGARIEPTGALADDVAEFAKVIVDLNAPSSGGPAGATRRYVSALGVRNLSRTFALDGKSLFGERDGENVEEADTRIEAVELGRLLDFWKLVDQDGSLLDELVDTANRPGPEVYPKLLSQLQSRLRRVPAGAPAPDRKMRECFREYVLGRGKEQAGPGKQLATEWRDGLERTHWLVTGEHVSYPRDEPKSVKRFPFNALAEKTLGTVALFSQLGLQIAHAIAQLYNIYRRGTFTEVILAGGVMSAETGNLVSRQAEAFFGRYYDKIYQHLSRPAVVVARTQEPETIGPLGAAMHANRAHRMKALTAMQQTIDRMIVDRLPGDTLRVDEILKACPDIRIRRENVRAYLQDLVAASVLLPVPGADDRYRKALQHQEG